MYWVVIVVYSITFTNTICLNGGMVDTRDLSLCIHSSFGDDRCDNAHHHLINLSAYREIYNVELP